MRIPNASRLFYGALLLVLTTNAVLAQSLSQAPAVAAIADQMVSARLSELERIHASILSEPWSAETSNRLRSLEVILMNFNAPGNERRVSLLLAKCKNARVEEEDVKGHQSYWSAYATDNDDVIPPKGQKSYWGAYADDEQSQQKGNQSYWDLEDRI